MHWVHWCVGALALAATAYVGPVAHANGQPRRGLEGGTLRGRVIDDVGRPLSGCRISIGSLLAGEEALHLLALPISIRTNLDGEYEARDVPAGDWYIRVEQDVLAPGVYDSENARGRSPSWATPDYPITYFPGVTDARLAKAVRVVRGASVGDLDIVVPHIPVFDLALKLSPLDALTSTAVEVFLNATQAGRPRAITPRDIEPGGIVRFKRLRSGPYFVWARARTPNEILAAWRRIEIASQTVEVDFSLTRAGRIAGRVVAADLNAISGARVVATLVDSGLALDHRDPDSVDMAEDGRFAIDGLFGERRLRMIGLPEGWTVRAIRQKGREIGMPLLVRSGASIDDIEIVVER
jgi:hypothetical protein